MKKVAIVLATVLTIAVQVHAQEIEGRDVPVNAKNSFVKKYSGKNARWEKEGDKYEATFKKGGKEISILIDAEGNIVETETEISKKDLPPAILATLMKDYTGYEIEEAAQIDANAATTYEVEVEVGEETFDLIFNTKGKLLKKKLYPKQEG